MEKQNNKNERGKHQKQNQNDKDQKKKTKDRCEYINSDMTNTKMAFQLDQPKKKADEVAKTEPVVGKKRTRKESDHMGPSGERHSSTNQEPDPTPPAKKQKIKEEPTKIPPLPTAPSNETESKPKKLVFKSNILNKYKSKDN